MKHIGGIFDNIDTQNKPAYFEVFRCEECNEEYKIFGLSIGKRRP